MYLMYIPRICVYIMRLGRLAMWAVAGMIMQGMTTHETLSKNLVDMLA